MKNTYRNWILITLVLSINSLKVLAGETVDIEKINQKIMETAVGTMSTCGEKIWSKFTLKEINLILVDESKEEQVSYSFKDNKKIAFNKKNLPSAALQFLYNFFDFENQRWMAINPIKFAEFGKNDFDFLVSESVKLIFHEGFHHTVQKDWVSKTQGSRGTTVPIAWEPRFYRAMIFQNLKTVYQVNFFNHTALRKARYWYDLWVKNYPLEISMTTDGYEGTAAYAETMGYAYSQYGCGYYKPELKPEVKKYILDNIDDGKLIFLNGSMFGLDVEGYAIGKIAGHILDQHNVIPNWKERLAQGETPLEQLMSLVTPKFHVIDDSKKDPFIHTQEVEQLKVDSYLSETYKNLNNNTSLYVSVPSAWAPSTFSPFDFYYDPSLKIQFTPMATEFISKNEESKSSLTSHPRAVYIEVEYNPCKQDG